MVVEGGAGRGGFGRAKWDDMGGMGLGYVGPFGISGVSSKTVRKVVWTWCPLCIYKGIRSRGHGIAYRVAAYA